MALYTYTLVSDDNNVVAVAGKQSCGTYRCRRWIQRAGRLMVTLSADDSYSQATIVVTLDTVAPVSFVPSSLVVGVETTQATGLLLTAAARKMAGLALHLYAACNNTRCE